MVKNVVNVISALKLKDRMSEIFFCGSCSDLKRVAAVMQDPFPALTDLILWLNDRMAPILSNSFLGGSAPQLLRCLTLHGILFLALPKLLFSATNLVYLRVEYIPHSRYISPKAMVTCLSMLTRLEQLIIQFKSPQSHLANASRC